MPRHLTAEQKLVRARTQLLLNHPFFGTLCVRLKLVPRSLPTMATNGRHIVYNPAYFDELKPAELEGVLAHEVLHCASRIIAAEASGIRSCGTRPQILRSTRFCSLVESRCLRACWSMPHSPT